VLSLILNFESLWISASAYCAETDFTANSDTVGRS
jgi:hypothetical protein